MKTLNWSGYKWYKQEPWGKIHPDKAWNYYDEKAIEVDKGLKEGFNVVLGKVVNKQVADSFGLEYIQL